MQCLDADATEMGWARRCCMTWYMGTNRFRAGFLLALVAPAPAPASRIVLSCRDLNEHEIGTSYGLLGERRGGCGLERGHECRHVFTLSRLIAL